MQSDPLWVRLTNLQKEGFLMNLNLSYFTNGKWQNAKFDFRLLLESC